MSFLELVVAKSFFLWGWYTLTLFSPMDIMLSYALDLFKFSE